MRIKGVSRRGRTVLGPGELVSAAPRETAPEQLLTELRPSASAVTLHLLSTSVVDQVLRSGDLQDLPETPQSSSAFTEWQPGWIISIVLSGYKQALFLPWPSYSETGFPLSGFPQRFTSDNKSFQEIPSRLKLSTASLSVTFLFTPSTKRKELILWRSTSCQLPTPLSMCRVAVHLFQSTFKTHSEVEGNTSMERVTSTKNNACGIPLPF